MTYPTDFRQKVLLLKEQEQFEMNGERCVGAHNWYEKGRSNVIGAFTFNDG